MATRTQDACADSEAGPQGVGLDARSKEKIAKEKGHPAWRLPGILHGKFVSRGRAFRQDSCPDEKESTSLSIPATRPVVPDSPPHRGPG